MTVAISASLKALKREVASQAEHWLDKAIEWENREGSENHKAHIEYLLETAAQREIASLSNTLEEFIARL